MLHKTNPQHWAERLALAQNARDELVRLLGVVNNLNNIVSSEASLREGSRKIVSTLAAYLNLLFCGLYIKRAAHLHLEAYSGQEPQAEMSHQILSHVNQGTSFCSQINEYDDEAWLHCLPIFNGETHMGAMAIISPYQFDDPAQRHFKLAIDSITPVVETFLLRGDNMSPEQNLARPARSLTFPPTPMQAALAQPASEELGSETGPGHTPQFVLDANGSLIRFNPALEKLVGLSRSRLTGYSLSSLFERPQEYEEIFSEMLDHRVEIEREVTLKVQAGWKIQARVTLIPIYYGSNLISISGHLEHPGQRNSAEHPLVPLPEAEELIYLSGEAIDRMNNMLTVFRNQAQLLLLKELPLEVRSRLEELEKLTMENSRVVRRAQHCVAGLSEKCRRIIGEFDLWSK